MRFLTLQGFTFIEVLISLLLLSLLLFALDASELTVMREARQTYYFSIAANQIENLADQLTSENPSTILTQWNNQNATLLPSGRGTCTGQFPHYQISIYWGDPSLQTCNNQSTGNSGCLTENMTLASHSLN
jgi:prepilin-type N-terminal cleavage/methylation domain-containing protein